MILTLSVGTMILLVEVGGLVAAALLRRYRLVLGLGIATVSSILWMSGAFRCSRDSWSNSS